MSIKTITAILFLTLIMVVSSVAQPPKNRGAGNSPSSGETPAAPGPGTNAVSAGAPRKKTIVVLDFNDAALSTFGTTRAVGKQLSALLTSEFVRRGNFTVVSQMDKEAAITAYQNKSQSDRSNRSFAAQIGQNLSANIVVFGDVLEYTVVTETAGFGPFAQAKHEAKMGFTLSLVDVNTAEVKDAATIEETANSKDTAIMGAVKAKTLTEDQKTSLLSAAAKKAVPKAVDALVRLIDVDSAAAAPQNANNLQPTNQPAAKQDAGKCKDNPSMFDKAKGVKKCPPKEAAGQPASNSAPPQGTTSEPVAAGGQRDVSAPAGNQAMVIEVSAKEITVADLPASAKRGTQLIVYRVTEIEHPVTKRKLKKEVEIGRIEVVAVQGDIATCKVVSGSDIKVEDLLKLAN